MDFELCHFTSKLIGEEKDTCKSFMAFNIVTCRLIFRRKLQFAILNYALDYTLHHKLSDYTLCTLYYHTLHPGVIFAIIFNRIMFHATNTCFLLRWNKVKRLKHPSSKSNKTKPKAIKIVLLSPLVIHLFH